MRNTEAPPGIWSLLTVVAGIGLAFSPAALGYVHRYHLPLLSALAIYGCFLLLLLNVVAPAIPTGRDLLHRLLDGKWKSIAVLLLLLLPYLIYAVGTMDFRRSALARLLLAAIPVLALYATPIHDRYKLNWQDCLAAAWLINVVLFHLLSGVWNVPVNLDFMLRLFVIALGALSWTYLRPVPGLCYDLSFHRETLNAASRNFAFFAAIAIPLGFLLGFTAWNPRWHGVLDFAVAYLQIFLFIAVLEELFFRGFLQNLLTKTWQCWPLGQLSAACLFGLFHVLHAPFPNWHYVALATIAGWFYGSAYRVGGLLSSVILHAMVDTVWRTFLTK